HATRHGKLTEPTFSLAQTPTNPQVAVFGGTPSEADVSSGVYATVRGTDSVGNTLDIDEGIDVFDPTDVPYAITQSLPAATSGQEYDLALKVDGATSLSTGITSVDGMAVSVSGTTLTISGVPDVPQTVPPDKDRSTIDVTMTYVVGGVTYTATQEFLLSVTPSGPAFAIQADGVADG